MTTMHTRSQAAMAAGIGGVLLAATAAVLSQSVGPHSPSASPKVAQSGVGINGHRLNSVDFNGRVMSFASFQRASKQSARSGHRTYTYFGAADIRAGHVLATTSPRQMKRWSGHDPRATPPEIAATPARIGGRSPAGNGVSTSCTYSHGVNNSVFWTGGSCSANYELMPLSGTRNSVIYNDAYSAIELGCRTSDLDVYKNASLGGQEATFAGDEQYTDLHFYLYPNGDIINDTISSYKVFSSGGSC